MRILVTGREGQVARSLAERAQHYPGLQLHFEARPELDLAQPGRSAERVRALAPDLIVNAAAYTAVDRAESEPELAQRINAEAAGELATAAADIGAAIVQLSTDYVFDGRSDRPWREEDRTGPINIYGRTKLAGEEAVRAANADHLILRTSWVVSPFGHNFVRTMLRLAAEREEVRVVGDQRGCPTSALDLADAILALAERRRAGVDGRWGATFHLAGSGSCSWAEFAVEIMRVAESLGLRAARVTPITTADYPTPAERPRCSLLDSSAFEERFGRRLPSWQDSTRAILDRLAVRSS